MVPQTPHYGGAVEWHFPATSSRVYKILVGRVVVWVLPDLGFCGFLFLFGEHRHQRFWFPTVDQIFLLLFCQLISERLLLETAVVKHL